MEHDDLLRDLADDPSEYLREGPEVLMTRQGRQYAFSLHEQPGVGIVVQDPEAQGGQELIPLLRYIQHRLLDLPRLAAQIVRAIDRASAARPTRYIEGSSEVTIGDSISNWRETSSSFLEFLSEQALGTTRLVQLMAGAGQGKTVLLEHLSKETASAYQPDPYPAPFLLTVDLLGRYVGTVDDAIAGSLNNTYMFPGLTQRDVALCVRRRWLILALDGFDELVARVGSRDAFLRITELLDQLKSAGTVILSARESFFQLYQISAAIRSYLQPRLGSYTTAAVRLLPWTEEQGRNVFTSLGSTSPETDLQNLLDAFGHDESIVLQPFFLTRLASLWMRGERFSEASSVTDPRWRTQYIIETFIERESKTKWINRDGQPLLSREGHTTLLAGIAEEMWRSGAYRLSDEELRIATQMTLAGSELPALILEAISERVPTHAALMAKDRGYTFLHDRFFHYYLATRLSESLAANNEVSTRAILGTRDLSPDILSWAEWIFSRDAERRNSALQYTLALSNEPTDKVLEGNIAQLLGLLLGGEETPYTVQGLAFSGETLRERRYIGQTFDRCEFWQLDFRDTVAENCVFSGCQFGEVLVNEGTRLQGSVLSDCTIRSLELTGDRLYYDPTSIIRELEQLGARVEASRAVEAQAAFAARIVPEVSDAIAKIIRKTQQTYDVSSSDIEEVFHDPRGLIRIGIDRGVLREIEKSASGPRKQFYRFTVDREMLLRGQAEITGDSRIDNFWEALAQKYRRQRN